MSDFKAGVGICTHRELRMKAHIGLRQLVKCTNPEISEINVDQDALISRSRSRVATHFLERTDYDILLFLDDDIVISTLDATKLMWMCYKQYPIIGGIYVTKSQDNPGLAARPIQKNGEMVFGKNGGVYDMEYLSTGCLAVRREVIESMKNQSELIDIHHCVHGDYKYWSFFQQRDVIINGIPEDTSEDWFFCNNASKLGYKIYADTTVMLGHIGNYEFTVQDIPNFKNRVISENVIIHYDSVHKDEAVKLK